MRRIHLSFMCRIHPMSMYQLIHASHSFLVYVSHSSNAHVSASRHLFMRCILSLFPRISHSAWSPPDQCSRNHYSCVALIYRSCVALIHSSYISYTALRPQLVSSLHPCITYTASCSLACFLSSSCIKSSIQCLVGEIRADGYKTPNSHIVVFL